MPRSLEDIEAMLEEGFGDADVDCWDYLVEQAPHELARVLGVVQAVLHECTEIEESANGSADEKTQFGMVYATSLIRRAIRLGLEK